MIVAVLGVMGDDIHMIKANGRVQRYGNSHCALREISMAR